MRPEEVPAELVKAAADCLQDNSLLWGAWEREQTEEQARKILAEVLPLHAQQLREAARAAATRPRVRPYTVVVTGHPQVFDRWCWENNRNPRDRTIIRIYDLHSAEIKLMGIGDFELVVLGEVPDHNQVMALISYRMATARREDPSH